MQNQQNDGTLTDKGCILINMEARVIDRLDKSRKITTFKSRSNYVIGTQKLLNVRVDHIKNRQVLDNDSLILWICNVLVE